MDGLIQDALKHGILAGVPWGDGIPSWAIACWWAVTEKRTKTDIDRLAATATGWQ